MDDAPILVMRGIRKTFGPVVALDGVDLDLRPGEVLGLLGGNGAGKTTLMNVLFGLYRADAGEILLDGRPVRITSPRDAIEQGIGMVHQHFLQVNRFTVLENVVLGTRLRNRPVVDLREARKRVIALSTRFGFELNPDDPLDQLAMGIRQRVEILKALYRGARILILDEPTTLLTPQEVDKLFHSLREMVQDGMSIIFITHKLREVMAVCDRITVLRNGRSVLTVERAQATEHALVSAMVGEALDVSHSLLFSHEGTPPEVLQVGDDPTVEAEGVTVLSPYGVPVLSDCTFQIREGEILGVAGVAGNGQRELAEMLLALRPLAQGRCRVLEVDLRVASTEMLLAQGVAYVPEDRWGDGFLPTATVAQNLILGQHRRPPYAQGIFLNRRAILERARDLIEEYHIVTEGPTATAANLSGGNIQRVLLARAFAAQPRFLILHNPTQGLDIPSIEFVYRRLLARKAQGMATLLISENLDELFLLSNRIAVLYNGQIMGIVPREAFDVYTIGRMMSGVQQHG